MALMGVPPKMFVIVGLIDLLYQFWVHTELVGRMGWFDRVFVSPSNHRVHHGQNDYCIDKNYGGLLVIWDRMFGTFAEERVGEKSPTVCASRCRLQHLVGQPALLRGLVEAGWPDQRLARQAGRVDGPTRRLDRPAH